jgi:hypothetical protein
MNVPTPIAIAKARKRTAMRRVENKKDSIFLSICKELKFLKVTQKYLKMLTIIAPQLLI